MTTATKVVSGHCAEQFGAIGEAFEASFAKHGELGGSVAVWVGGEQVVDLWGGRRGAQLDAPWSADTVVNVWSTTKGVVAICFAMLVDRGQVAYEDRVAKFWPEFATKGKDAVTVAQLLSHQAGLTGFDTPATMEDYYSKSAADRLAAQAPFWPLGEGAGYHALSYGNLASALCRKIDGRFIRDFVAEEFHDKLGLDISIGVAAGQESRVADLDAAAGIDLSGRKMTPAQFAAHSNPPELATEPLLGNSPGWRAAELPGANCTTNARALADLYSRLLASSRAPLVSQKTVAEASRERWAGIDLVNGADSRWAAGFQGNCNGLHGPNPSTFGHGGRGGSFAFADPEADVAMAYAMNRMAPDGARERPRRDGLIQALYASL